MENSDIKGLVDIIGPQASAAPAESLPLWYFAAAGLLLLLVLTGMALWRSRSAPRRRSLNSLKLLRRRIERNALSAQASGYLLAVEMCRWFGIQRLAPDAMPSGFSPSEQESWQRFVASLDSLRYRPGDEQKKRCAALQLLAQARLWIERTKPC